MKLNVLELREGFLQLGAMRCLSVFSAAALCLSIAPAQGTTILDNVSGSTTSGGSNSLGRSGASQYRQSISFESPSGQAWTLNSADLFVSSLGNSTPVQMKASLFLANDSTNLPNEAGGALATTVTTWAFSSLSWQSITFSGAGWTLLPDEKYALVFEVTTASRNVTWNSQSPTVPYAGYEGFDFLIRGRSVGGGVWSSPGSLDGFKLEATAVPEPTEYAAAAGLGLLAFAGWRRYRKASPAAAV